MSADNRTLNGRTAIVTGASSGIGLAIAKQLAQAGTHVFLAGRTAEPMEEAKYTIEQEGGNATVVTADLRDPLQVQNLVDGAVTRTGRLDVMVITRASSSPPPSWMEVLMSGAQC